jgi:DNA-binding transcriptional ArsR family regulator
LTIVLALVKLNPMVNTTDSEILDATFSALSDPTRRSILLRLAQGGEATVSQLAEPYEMSLPAISKHLRVLTDAGLLRRRKEGRAHWISLNAAHMKTAAEWLAYYRQFWGDSLDALATLVEDDEATE